MYLKFETRSEFPALAEALCADLTEDMIDWDSENVYEWMYVDLPQLAFSLNISREHGWANVDNDTMDQYRDNEDKLKEHVHPGAVYVFGWDRKVSDYVDQLPDFLPAFIGLMLQGD